MKPLLQSLVISVGNILHIIKLLLFEPIRSVFALILPSKKQIDFSNKICWITGAGSGIGRALAIQCAQLGSHVVITSRSKDRLEKVAIECQQAINSNSSSGNKSNEQKVLVYPLDLANYSRAPEYYKDLETLLRQNNLQTSVDVLFNVAGTSSRGSVVSSKVSTTESIMNINFYAPVALTKAVLPSMINNPAVSSSKHIVVVSSVQGKIAIPFRSSYSASKFACEGYFGSLRSEVVDSNIKVLLVSPGYVATDLSIKALNGDGSTYGITDESTAKGMKPEVLALKITTAMEQGIEDLVEADLMTNLAIYLRSMWPDVYSEVMNKRARKQAKMKES